MISSALPSQKYRLEDNSGEVELDSRIQTVFNNYLLEKAYHCYALGTIECIIVNHTFDLDSFTMQNVMRILHIPLFLHAPLLHPPFIKLLDYLFSQTKIQAPTIVSIIVEWAKILPKLEDTFAQNVKNVYGSDLNGVFSEIRKAMLAEDSLRCKRLSFTRLIQSPSQVDSSENHHLSAIQQHKILKNSYKASLLFDYCSQEENTSILTNMLLGED